MSFNCMDVVWPQKSDFKKYITAIENHLLTVVANAFRTIVHSADGYTIYLTDKNLWEEYKLVKIMYSTYQDLTQIMNGCEKNK